MISLINNIYSRYLISTTSMVLTSLAISSAASAAPPEKIYQDSCAFCHSRVIPPFVAPELRGRDLPPDLIKLFVRNGGKGMITFTKANISDEELDKLAKWIKTSPAPALPKMPPMPGQARPDQGAQQ